MDALLAYIPDWINYWLLAFVVSLLLNVWQYAEKRGLVSKLGHVFEHGHAPDGKTLVPADSVTIDVPTPTIRPFKPDPWDKP